MNVLFSRIVLTLANHFLDLPVSRLLKQLEAIQNKIVSLF